jgi:hypothetical protein
MKAMIKIQYGWVIVQLTLTLSLSPMGRGVR